jgi:hypothetical protein
MSDSNKKDDTMKQILPFEPSTLETIDYSIYNWLTKELDLSCTTNKGFKKVPIVWVAGERANQIKNNKDLRDSEGALIFPIITLQRNGFTKDLSDKGYFYGNVDPVGDKKGGSVTIAREIKQDKTANFLNADSARRYGVNGVVQPTGGQINFPNKKKDKKVVYETITVPMPVYVSVDYTISIRTEYQQQINELIQPFVVNAGGINYRVLLSHQGHRYESFMQSDFSSNNNITELTEETRVYETTVNMKVLGYLIGADSNQKQPFVVRRENAVAVRTPREHVIFGDIPDWKGGKYND